MYAVGSMGWRMAGQKAQADGQAALISIEGQLGVDPAGGPDAQRQFRQTLGQFATGVTVMTCMGPNGSRIGVTVNSFTSLSLNPPLIMWALADSSANFGSFEAGAPFAVNVLSIDQEQAARQFATPAGDKFANIDIHEGIDGVPLIVGCVAYLECRTEARYPGGDHEIIVGRVRRVFNIARRPLLFHGGQFHVPHL